MDPAQLSIIAHAAETVLGVLVVLGMPAVIIFTLKHFKLRHRELELEAELHGKQTQLRLQALEARLGAIEAALGALGPARSSAQERTALLEPPPVPRQKIT